MSLVLLIGCKHNDTVTVDASEYASLLEIAEEAKTTTHVTQIETTVHVTQATERSNTYDYNYVANTNTKKFHKPDCPSVDQMAEKNKWYFTGTRDQLIEDGYKPCQRCNP